MKRWTEEPQNRSAWQYELLVVVVIGIVMTLFWAKCAPGQVVRVESHNGNTRGVGSGFVFAQKDGTALVGTCSHNIEGRMRVITEQGEQLAATVVLREHPSAMEWAVLSVRPARKLAVMPLANRKPRIGEQVVAWGHSGGGPLTKRSGKIVATGSHKMPRSNVPLIETNFPVQQGMSGGPLVGEDGNVIGVVWGSNERTHATPIQYTHQVTLTQCRGGSCGWYPGWWSQRNQYARQQGRNRIAAITPPATKPPPGFVTVKHWNESIETIDKNFREQRAKIDANANRIAALEAIKPQRGERGEKGERGPAGPPGTNADNNALLARIDELETQLAKSGFWYQSLDHKGKPYGKKVWVPLGKTLAVKPDMVEIKK